MSGFRIYRSLALFIILFFLCITENFATASTENIEKAIYEQSYEQIKEKFDYVKSKTEYLSENLSKFQKAIETWRNATTREAQRRGIKDIDELLDNLNEDAIKKLIETGLGEEAVKQLEEIEKSFGIKLSDKVNLWELLRIDPRKAFDYMYNLSAFERTLRKEKIFDYLQKAQGYMEKGEGYLKTVGQMVEFVKLFDPTLTDPDSATGNLKRIGGVLTYAQKFTDEIPAIGQVIGFYIEATKEFSAALDTLDKKIKEARQGALCGQFLRDKDVQNAFEKDCPGCPCQSYLSINEDYPFLKPIRGWEGFEKGDIFLYLDENSHTMIKGNNFKTLYRYFTALKSSRSEINRKLVTHEHLMSIAMAIIGDRNINEHVAKFSEYYEELEGKNSYNFKKVIEVLKHLLEDMKLLKDFKITSEDGKAEYLIGSGKKDEFEALCFFNANFRKKVESLINGFSDHIYVRGEVEPKDKDTIIKKIEIWIDNEVVRNVSCKPQTEAKKCFYEYAVQKDWEFKVWVHAENFKDAYLKHKVSSELLNVIPTIYLESTSCNDLLKLCEEIRKKLNDLGKAIEKSFKDNSTKPFKEQYESFKNEADPVVKELSQFVIPRMTHLTEVYKNLTDSISSMERILYSVGENISFIEDTIRTTYRLASVNAKECLEICLVCEDKEEAKKKGINLDEKEAYDSLLKCHNENFHVFATNVYEFIEKRNNLIKQFIKNYTKGKESLTEAKKFLDKQQCTYNYSDWSPCDSETKKQTRKVLSKEPEGCIEKEKPIIERECVPEKGEEGTGKEDIEKENIGKDTEDKPKEKEITGKEKPGCSYDYSDWGPCDRNSKKQKRTVIGKKPEGCVERQKPELEQGCTPPPTEEEKRYQYFNCLCVCSGGWAPHIGVWYDPEEKTKPECKSNGPCIGGIGAFGCSWRHFFKAPDECAKGCWESAFGKGTYDAKKADKMRREENKKYAKPLTVKLQASKNPADFGDLINIQAQAQEGTGGYSYKWSGCAQDAKDSNAKVSFKNECKSCTVSVTVTDQDDNSASDSLQIKCNEIKVKLTKESPKEDTIPIGSKANFLAEVFSGDKPADGTFYYIWEPSPEIIFGDPKNPTKETKGGSQYRHTALFNKKGDFKVWVNVLKEIDERKVTVGESEQITVRVVNPTLKLTTNTKEPLVGEKVVLTVQEEPKTSDDVITFWWEYSGNVLNPGVEQNISNSRAYSFKPKDTKPVTITVHAKAKDGGDDLGEAKITINPKSYTVSISEPRYLGPKPRIWKCDTQFGGACPGLVEVSDTQFAVFRDIFLKATVTPKSDSPRYRWTVESAGSCGFPGAGDEIKINCSQTGTYTVKVEVTDAEGVKLGEATQSVTVSISQEQLDNANKSKDAFDKLQKAKSLVTEGKLDEAINLAQEATTSDPKNMEAKNLLEKWKKEKEGINKNIENANRFINENKFGEAEKEINQAKSLHPRYAKVLEAEKRLNEQKNKYQKEVISKINEAKKLLDEKKIDESIQVIKEVAKVDKTSAQPVMNQISQEAKKAGWDALYNGDYKLAVKRLEQAVELAPDDSDAQKKLKEAKNYESKMPIIDAKMKEFDRLIAEKKIVSSHQKMLEIHDILRSIGSSGQSSNNPVIIKCNKDYNELNKWYNELIQKTDAEWTRLFQKKDWKSAETLLTEVLKYEHTEANKRNYESSLQMVRNNLAEEKNKKQKADQLWEECISLAKQNRQSEALSKCKESLSLIPDERRKQALKQLENEVARKQKADELWNQCVNLTKQNKLKEAVSACEQSLSLWSNEDRKKALNALNAEAKKTEEQSKRKAQADRLWEDCIALAKADHLNEAVAKCEESLSYWSNEERQKALTQLRNTAQKTSEEAQKKAIADRLWNECIEFAKRGQIEQAWKLCDESLKHWRNDKRVEATMKLKEEARKVATTQTAEGGGRDDTSQPIPPSQIVSQPVAGKWKTNWGEMELTVNGDYVTGGYSVDQGTIEGKLNGNILDGYWTEAQSGKRCAVQRNGSYYWGKLRFVFEGNIFRGNWSYCDEPILTNANQWTGEKISSIPTQSQTSSSTQHKPQVISNNGTQQEVGYIDLSGTQWTWFDPKADAAYTVMGDTIIIKAPNGNDLWPSFNFDAPRLTKRVSGDFSLKVRVRADWRENYNGAGLTVYSGKDSVVRFERGIHGVIGGHHVVIFGFANGRETGRASIAFPSSDVYLKLERSGNKFTGYASTDGTNWMKVGTIEARLPETVEAGLTLVNQHNNGVFQATFSDFQLLGKSRIGIHSGDGVSPPDSSAKGKVIFNNWNIAGVYNNPTRPTTFTLNQSYVITLIQNYHWNNAKGSTPGTIALKDQSGRIYGPWQAKGTPGQGGVPNANWNVYPNITLSAGTYTVIDSEPSTWSQNIGSNGAGFTRIEGYPASSSITPPLLLLFRTVTFSKE